MSSGTPERKRKHQFPDLAPTVSDEQEEEAVSVPTHWEVFVDGSCLNNGGAGETRRAGFGMWWGSDHDPRTLASPFPPPLKVEPRFRDLTVTNNRAELYAVLRALEMFSRRAHPHSTDRLIIKTDSMLTVNTANVWRKGWAKKGWKKSDGKTPENLDLVQALHQLLENLPSHSYEIIHVRGHSKIYGNERADFLARQGSEMSGSQ